jgi:hypothetical protein
MTLLPGVLTRVLFSIAVAGTVTSAIFCGLALVAAARFARR